MDITNPIESLLAAMAEHGLNPNTINADGKIYRFDVDKKNDQAGWYVFYHGEISGAAFGNWKTGLLGKWCSHANKQMTTSQFKNYQNQVAKAKKEAEQIEKENHAKTKIKANKIWNESKPVSEHEYLKNKNVKSYYLRVDSNNTLLIPMKDEKKEIWNLERISAQPGAKKKGLYLGLRKGLFFEIPGSNQVYICEGYSTGATIHEATGATVICSFNAGNLPKVSILIRKLYPGNDITIAADNDQFIVDKQGKKLPNVGIEKANEAAKEINASIVYPAFKDISSKPTDYNDLASLEGLEAVKGQLRNNFDKVIPLRETQAQKIDSNSLPGIIGDIVKAVSRETETPLELATGAVFGVLSTSCQGKIVVRIKPGYIEPVNIWPVTALDSANRKSSVLIQMTKPLSQWEALKHAELDLVIKEKASKRKNQEARIKSLRIQYAKAASENLKDIENEIFETENNLEQVPSYPKIWAQDVTPEHLGTLLHNHNEKMAIISAEGGIFDIIGGRYSNGVGNLDLFLQGHSGDPVRVDRGSREPVFLNKPALTLCLSPQPEVLRGLVDKPGFRGKGLLARFLYLLPESNLGYRGLESESVPENITLNYQDLIFKLLNIEPSENEQNEQQPYILNLSKKAYQEWASFYMVVEKDLREGRRFEYIKDWAGKLSGAAARIAGLLHCAENPDQPWSKEIGLETMEAALEIASVFASHALIAFDLMGADKSLEQARKVWRWVERNRFESFTKRDCFNALQGTFQKVANIEEPLSVLIERNYIRAITQKTGGRPSVKYNVNPEIIERWL